MAVAAAEGRVVPERPLSGEAMSEKEGDASRVEVRRDADSREIQKRLLNASHSESQDQTLEGAILHDAQDPTKRVLAEPDQRVGAVP